MKLKIFKEFFRLNKNEYSKNYLIKVLWLTLTKLLISPRFKQLRIDLRTFKLYFESYTFIPKRWSAQYVTISYPHAIRITLKNLRPTACYVGGISMMPMHLVRQYSVVQASDWTVLRGVSHLYFQVECTNIILNPDVSHTSEL